MSAIGQLLAAARHMHEATPALSSFAPWPEDLSDQKVLPGPCPASAPLGVRSLRGTWATARVHASHQPHLMVALDQPVLAYVVWRGARFDGLTRMLRP